MSFQKDIFALLARFAGTDNTVAVPRVFCQITGSLEAGTFLSQLLYWSDRGKSSDGWFYKSYAEWHDEIFLSEYQIRKLTKEFVDAGFLETQLKKANGAPTLHYRIKKPEFSEWILKFFSNQDSEIFQNGNPNIQESITKTTTETTQRGGSPPAAQQDPFLQAAIDKFNGKAKGGQKARLDGVREDLQALQIPDPQFRQLVDAYLAAKGTKTLADLPTDEGDRELNDAQDAVLQLVQIGKRFRQTEWVTKLWAMWAEEDKRPNPTKKQLLEFAAKVVSRGQPATNEKPLLRQWMLQKFGTDVDAAIHDYTPEQIREMYRQQFPH